MDQEARGRGSAPEAELRGVTTDPVVHDHGFHRTAEPQMQEPEVVVVTTTPAEPGSAHRVVEGDRLDILDQIWSPGCAVSIWKRNGGWTLLDRLEELSPEQLPELRMATDPDHALSALGTEVQRLGLGDSGFGPDLLEDASKLVRSFCNVMKTNTVRLRFDVIRSDACRKFHLDNVVARLLCTYRGRGTQYGQFRTEGDPDPIHELATGDVGLFRGQLWPTGEGSGIVHRSPPISQGGETRLLFVIDDGGPEAGCSRSAAGALGLQACPTNSKR